MKKFYTFDIKISEGLKSKVESMIKDINLIENVTAKYEGDVIKVKYLSEEIAPGNREGAEELKDTILKAIEKYHELKDKKEDEEKMIDNEKEFTVVLDPRDIKKLSKVNPEGMKQAYTGAVEVKESKYVTFIQECAKEGIRIRDTYLKEDYEDPDTPYAAAEIGLKSGENISKDYLEGLIYGSEGKKVIELDNLTKEDIKSKFPAIAKILGL